MSGGADAELARLEAELQPLLEAKKAKEAELREMSQRIEELQRKKQHLAALLDAAKKGEDAESKAGEGGGSVWNVNSWHWEERNLKSWVKGRMEELFVGLEIEIPGGKCTITEVSKLDGDATMNVRKGKRRVGFELSLEFKCKTLLVDGDGKELVNAEGKLTVPELSNDYDDDDDVEVRAEDRGGGEVGLIPLAQVEVSLDGSSSGHDRAKDGMRSRGVPEVRKRLKQVSKELLEHEK